MQIQATRARHSAIVDTIIVGIDTLVYPVSVSGFVVFRAIMHMLLT